MAGDDDRFAALYRNHYRNVYAYCRRRADADTADDVVADVFLAVWRRIEDAPAGEGLLPWLYRVAYLTTSNHWRGRSRQKKLKTKLDSMGLDTIEPVPDQIVAREEVRGALSALEDLRPADREIIKLSVWEGLSHDEIAAVLDLTPEATRQRLHRAKKRLTETYTRRHAKATSPAAQEGGER